MNWFTLTLLHPFSKALHISLWAPGCNSSRMTAFPFGKTLLLLLLGSQIPPKIAPVELVLLLHSWNEFLWFLLTPRKVILNECSTLRFNVMTLMRELIITSFSICLIMILWHAGLWHWQTKTGDDCSWGTKLHVPMSSIENGLHISCSLQHSQHLA